MSIASLFLPSGGGGGGSIPNPLTVPLVITPAAPNVTPLTINQSLTGAAANAALAINPTWNTSGTPTAIDLNVTDTASNAASLLLALRTGGTNRFTVSKTGLIKTAALGGVADNAFSLTTRLDTGLSFSQGGGVYGVFVSALGSIVASISLNNASGNEPSVRLPSNGYFAFVNGANPDTGTVDVVLRREAAAIMSQRNGTSAQTFRVYGTFTDASNGEWLEATLSAGEFRLQVDQNGTGVQRGLMIGTRGNNNLRFMINNNATWQIGTGTHFQPINNNAQDIGIDASRVRNLLMASFIEQVEEVDPAAPAVNRARIYARDNGGGKTQLCVRFNTGAVQVLATEP